MYFYYYYFFKFIKRTAMSNLAGQFGPADHMFGTPDLVSASKRGLVWATSYTVRVHVLYALAHKDFF